MSALSSFEFIPAITKPLPFDLGSISRFRWTHSFSCMDLLSSLPKPYSPTDDELIQFSFLRNSESFRSPSHPGHTNAFFDGKSSEAPARMETPLESTKHARSRSRAPSLPCNISTNSLQLDSPEEDPELAQLVHRAEAGIRAGIAPTIAEGGLGGAYFVRDSKRVIAVVCKPGDEEPNAFMSPNLRKGYSNKGAVTPGFGMYRELIAAILDEGFCGVPPTQLGRLRHDVLKGTSCDSLSNWSRRYKRCSVQAYVRAECSAEDMGPSMFDTDDIHRIAVLDIRLCNLDRHEGNLLVARESPYQRDCAAIRPIRSSARLLFGDLQQGQSTPLSSCLASSQVAASSSSEESNRSSPHFVVDNSIHVCASAPQPSRMLQYFQCSSSSSPLRDLELSQLSSPPLSRIASPANSTSKKATLFRLVPIDHGFILPHVLRMSETSFAWLNWPQVHMPLSQQIVEYVASLDYRKDIERIKGIVGAALPDSCLLTLQVCTVFLQLAVGAGLTLFQIGSAMSAPDTLSSVDVETNRFESCSNASRFSESCLSAVQRAVHEAIQRTIAIQILTGASPLTMLKDVRRECVRSEQTQDEVTRCATTIPVTEESLQLAMNLRSGDLLSSQLVLVLEKLVHAIRHDTIATLARNGL